MRPGARFEQVERGERRVHAHQRFPVRCDLSAHESELRLTGELLEIGDELERAEARLDGALCNALDERLVLASVADEIGDRADLKAVPFAEFE